MSEIKKLGFGLMRLPQNSANGADIDDDNAYGVPISGIIRAYNSMFIQPDPFFSAELNYYKSFRSAFDLAFERGDYSRETAKIGGAFDVTAALKEAVKTQAENSFQSYMD